MENYQKTITKTVSRKMKKNWIPYVFIAPNFIGFFIFILFPVVSSLIISFTDFNIFTGIEGTSFVNLKNYTNAFKDDWFTKSVTNNVLYSVVTIPITMILAITISAILNYNVYGKNILKSMMFIPYITSVSTVAIVWLQLFNPSQGIINQALRALGVTNTPGWLGSIQWALPAIMIVGIWSNLGYNIIVYYAGLQGIPSDLYEAARIDGANGFGLFRHITVPMLKNTTFFLTITNIISSFQVFGTVNIMTDGGPGTATTVIAHYIYIAGFRYHKMSYAAAMAWLLFLGIFLITAFRWRQQKKFESNF